MAACERVRPDFKHLAVAKQHLPAYIACVVCEVRALTLAIAENRKKRGIRRDTQVRRSHLAQAEQPIQSVAARLAAFDSTYGIPARQTGRGICQRQIGSKCILPDLMTALRSVIPARTSVALLLGRQTGKSRTHGGRISAQIG